MNDRNHDKIVDEVQPVQSPASEAGRPEVPKKGRARRVLRWAAFGMAGFLGLVTLSAGGGLLFLRSDSGERLLASTINDALNALPSGLSGQIASFHGPLPGAACITDLVLKDRHGTWLRAENATVRIDWSALPSAFVISEISVDKPVLLRTPEIDPSTEPAPEAEAPSATPKEMLAQFGDFLTNWPSWLPELRLDEAALRFAAVTKAVTPYPFTASVQASASAGREGLAADMRVEREDGPLPADAPNRQASFAATLSPGLALGLDARLSDLGFATAFLSEKFMKQPAFELAIQGSAPVEDWKASFSGAFRDDALGGEAAARSILALNASLGLRPLDDAPSAVFSMDADSGAAVRQLWPMLGQKDGRFSVKLDAKASSGIESKASTSLDIKLADMQWGTDLLDALLGKEAGGELVAEACLGKNGAMSADLAKFSAKAAHVAAELSGKAVLDEGRLASASSRADFKGVFSLNDAATLSPALSGDMSADFSVAGPFTELAAEIGLRSTRMDTPATKLKDVKASVTIASADIASLAGEKRSSGKAGEALLDGSARASLHINDTPVRLDSRWKAEDSASAIKFLLDGLALRAGGNSVTGHLEAAMPKSSASPSKDTVAALVGTAFPALDGALDIAVSDWSALTSLSGIPLSGEALRASLSLKNSGRQDMAFSFSLPSLTAHIAEKDVNIIEARAEAVASDLWGHPSASVRTTLAGVKADTMELGPTTASVKGGLDTLSFDVQSSGGLESDIKARWKPGELFLDTLEARLEPAHLGLSEGPAVGIALSAPFSLAYSGDSVTLRDFSADLIPAGRLDVSGRFSPKQFDGRLSLADVELAHYQHLVQGMPAGDIDMQAEFSGTPYAPAGKFKLDLKDIQLSGSTLPPLDSAVSATMGMSGKRRMLHAEVDIPEDTQKALGLTRFTCKADVPFTSPSSGMAMPDMKAPLNASLSLGGQMEGLWKLVPAPDQKLFGLVDVDASVAGTASAPKMSAHVSMKDGMFRDIMQGVELRDIHLNVDADNIDFARKKAEQRISLNLSASDSRKGSLKLGGWFDPVSLALDIDGALDKLSPLRRPDIRVQLSGDIGVEGTAQSPLVKAAITVDKGEVEIAKLPGGSVSTLEIWTPEDEKKKDEAPAVPGHLDVSISIPNQFFVRGYGLDCEWSGRLRIDAPLTKPAVNGRLQAVRGTLDILGKNFKLAEGEIRFDGGWPVSPLLNIDMQYEAASITADIIVGGTASDPKLTLTSQPEMPQDEVLSQIMFGTSSGSLSHAQAIQLASGAASLAGFGGAGVMDFGRKLLGVDVFKVNSDNDGEDSDVSRTSLEMGTYVHDNVYVGVDQGVGKESDTGAVVEIELLPSLELQAKTSSSDTEVGLEWKKNY